MARIGHSVRVAMNINEFITMTNRNIKDYEDFEEALNKGCSTGSVGTRYFKPINQLLLIINSTVNFFIYVIFDKGLKVALRQMSITKTIFRILGFDENIPTQPSNRDRTTTEGINNMEMTAVTGDIV